MTNDFRGLRETLITQLIRDGEEVDVGEWQSREISHPLQVSVELTYIGFKYNVPATLEILQRDIRPDIPWAENHFLERVSGEPLNPPPSERYWPWRDKTQDNEEFKSKAVFSHTYPERYWPKQAGRFFDQTGEDVSAYGIRYSYGDLYDVVKQLQRNPLTRQAYLPVWFPEDTGAIEGQRVPCSIGYHFLIRQGKMDCTYYIRSCDLLRHFQNDVYMTARLMQWIVEHLHRVDIRAGALRMHIGSLHVFKGDLPKLRKIQQELRDERYRV